MRYGPRMAEKKSGKPKSGKKRVAKGAGLFLVTKKLLGGLTKLAALAAVGAAVTKILRRGR